MDYITRLSRFARYAWLLLGYNLLVILWGAYVRATGSGAGCGAHWPLCNGEVVPRSPQIETLIEFTHRLSSGLVLPLVLILLVWAWRAYPRHHAVRAGAGLAVFFTITEALVGAGLVLFGLTAENDSLSRAYVMMIHLVNTFLLLATLALTAWWASGQPPERSTGRRGLGVVFGLAAVGLCVLGASGAIAALGDTLFPAQSLTSALQEDFSSSAHILLRLRVLHPAIAVTTSLLVGALAIWARKKYPHHRAQQLAGALIGLLGLQLTLGVVNVILLAPVWMQLIHLLVADLVWIQLILLGAVVLGTVDLIVSLPEQKVHDRVHDPKRVA